MFYVNQLTLAGVYDRSYAPRTEAYLIRLLGNICELEQQGLFESAPRQFPHRGNRSNCESIGNGILKSGYTAATLHFLEQANRNFLDNTLAVTYSPAQKVAYLNNAFNTQTAGIVDYFILMN
jgi:hypothetical protein